MDQPCVDLTGYPAWVVLALAFIGLLRIALPLVRLGGSSWSNRRAQKRRTRQGRKPPY